MHLKRWSGGPRLRINLTQGDPEKSEIAKSSMRSISIYLPWSDADDWPVIER